MARRKLFDRPVDKEMVERAKQVCKEYTVAKRELPVLEQDLARLATKRTEEKNKVMRQLYLEKEQELQKMVDQDKEIITLFTAGEEFLEGTPREVIIQKFLNGFLYPLIKTLLQSLIVFKVADFIIKKNIFIYYRAWHFYIPLCIYCFPF